MSVIHTLISKSLNIPIRNVENSIKLLEEGATIPFISRYRKEVTGGLDEVKIANIKELNEKYTELEKRKEYVLKSISEQEKLTPELEKKITDCWDSTELEDIYLPYKPKRQTRAEIARKNGLEPLAKWLMAQYHGSPEAKATQYLNEKVADTEAALKGARDIIAEWVNEDAHARQMVRNMFARDAIIISKVVKGKEEEGEKYRDYFDFSAPLSRCPSHRILAIRRGEVEGFLRVSISPDDEKCLDRLVPRYAKNDTEAADQVEDAVTDSYKRLLKPSIETEFGNLSKKQADEAAIAVFAENLRQLLLAPPLGQKRILGVDPGYRTGCKLVCLDEQGNLLHNETIYPHPPQNEFTKSASKVVKLVSTYRIDAIAIGNGTASRETERFITSLRYEKEVKVFVVSESGASVYSASKIAREEFPEYDVTVRGAVSIGRRLSDPLAELVKIDPKSIGVGQYQHDVDQTKLKRSLDQTVENCVNLVGVNLNTASKHLLTYISGLGEVLAQNIVNWRTENGPFRSRKELKKVARLGEKAFEQCAGFLRIPDAENPLDNSAVHPESYAIVEQMAEDLQCTVKELIRNKPLIGTIDINRYKTEKVGEETLTDILQELEKPGRDPRTKVQVLEFDPNIRAINDLKEGMILPGIVTNITNFGCFVDVGIKENGLVHISELADRFVSSPTDVVSLHQHVKVRVLSVDLERKRIQLSMKKVEADC
ncbi:Transcriptional accessory protein Tex/SPT6 [Proteiniphilum saccharofermentans]|uniref:Transcriptional accessory protein Tex/SPT6 n=1 Tax=Proteiniphilum saccharofermentans TaxID=1642647 RepID=A0A1R3SZJ5_9BACT|nr:Tex family protein [Proteiniphilum saccharofermentans]SCD19222.1 Transcriptional accessory protein Tex/SPT6 [Proteiniphilum saccharofermentans]